MCSADGELGDNRGSAGLVRLWRLRIGAGRLAGIKQVIPPFTFFPRVVMARYGYGAASYGAEDVSHGELLEIRPMTETLVINEEDVYDPTQYGDRLLLGIVGALSEAELHRLRWRLLGGQLDNARKGEFRMRSGRRGDGRYSARAVAALLGLNMSTVVGWCRTERLYGVKTIRDGPWWIKPIAENIAELSKPNEYGQRGDGRYTTRAAAAVLNRHPRTIAIWCRSGRLEGIQASRDVGWRVKLTAAEIDELHRLE